MDIFNNNLLIFCGFKNVLDGFIGFLIKIFKVNWIYCVVGKLIFVSWKFFKFFCKIFLEELYFDDNKIDYGEFKIVVELLVMFRKLFLNGNKLFLGCYIF